MADGTMNLKADIVGDKRDASPWVRVPNMLIPDKKIAMDEPGGSLQYIADISTKTPTGQYNLINSDAWRTPMTINIQASAARSEGGVPVVYPKEVRFEFDTKHVGVAGYVRASKDATVVDDAATYAGNFHFNGTDVRVTENGTLLKDYGGATFHTTAATALTTAFTTGKEDICHRQSPYYTVSASVAANDDLHKIVLPTLARNTRLEIFKSVELKFNNSTTVMKITDPGRLYKYTNDFFAPKLLRSDECGDLATCPTQYTFPQKFNDTSYLVTESNEPSLTESINPVNGDQRRYHSGEWFENSRIGFDGKYTVYLSDIFPAFDKNELMTMPAMTITFNWAENFRELFTVYPNTFVDVTTTATSTNISYSPSIYDTTPAVNATAFDHTTKTGTSVYYKNKDYFGIVGCTYKAPTYATKHIMVPRLFNNAYKSYELVEHSITNIDPTVRIIKTLTRAPIGAFIFFETIAAENGPLNTVGSEYVQNTFNNRWWPKNRQVVKVTTFKDSLEQTLGTSEYMQWQGTNGRRLNREHLVREARELSGNRTRQMNHFWADSADFVKKPFIAVRFDNDVVDPSSVKTTVTDTRYVTNEYIIELKFDHIDPSPGGNVIDSSMMSGVGRKLITVFIYEHNFKTLGDNVISTQVV